MIRSIIAGFDGSDASERALAMACDLARKFDAKIAVAHTPLDETVTYAAEAISGFYVGPNPARGELLREAAEKMAERARSIAAEAGAADMTVHIGHGDPADDLLDFARQEAADLIVTGRRGLGAMKGLILGSTSQAVAARADCPCLTVP